MSDTLAQSKRAAFRTRLKRLGGDIDKLAAEVTAARDDAMAYSGDKADYRSIGRRLEMALAQIELALERCE